MILLAIGFFHDIPAISEDLPAQSSSTLRIPDFLTIASFALETGLTRRRIDQQPDIVPLGQGGIFFRDCLTILYCACDIQSDGVQSPPLRPPIHSLSP